MVSHINIFGEVGKDVTLQNVLSKITPKAESYVVHIHSPGGDVFEGFAIYNALKNTGKEIEMRIEGVCASIAMTILSAASPGKIFSNSKGQLMVHNPKFQNVSGEEKDLRNAADLLKQIKSQFIKEWTGRTGLEASVLSQMYDTETWLTPEQAKEMGFIDEIQDSLKAVAYGDYKKFTHMKDKNKIMAMVDNLGKALTKFLSPKAMTHTLSNGQQIEVDSEDGEWIGKSITYVDGTPVPPGEYTLEDTKEVLMVGEGSTITEVRTPETEAQTTEETPEDMKKLEEAQAKITELEAKNKELESALEARNTAATKAEAKVVALETKMNSEVKKLAEELEKIKVTTVGDDTPPQLPLRQPAASGAVVDPMKQLFGKLIIDPRK